MPLSKSSELCASNQRNKAYLPNHGYGIANGWYFGDQPHQESSSIPSYIAPELHNQTLYTISFQVELNMKHNIPHEIIAYPQKSTLLHPGNCMNLDKIQVLDYLMQSSFASICSSKWGKSVWMPHHTISQGVNNSIKQHSLHACGQVYASSFWSLINEVFFMDNHCQKIMLLPASLSKLQYCWYAAKNANAPWTVMITSS